MILSEDTEDTIRALMLTTPDVPISHLLMEYTIAKDEPVKMSLQKRQTNQNPEEDIREAVATEHPLKTQTPRRVPLSLILYVWSCDNSLKFASLLQRRYLPSNSKASTFLLPSPQNSHHITLLVSTHLLHCPKKFPLTPNLLLPHVQPPRQDKNPPTVCIPEPTATKLYEIAFKKPKKKRRMKMPQGKKFLIFLFWNTMTLVLGTTEVQH